jgi:prolyl-tRNA synthetase
MRLSRLAGTRFKETPAECQIASHILTVRGGYIKNVGSGIISLFPPAKRITKKIEAIIREEVDAIGGQEVLLPVAMPAALWKESGRWESVGSELARFKDRNGSDMVLGMTHEEAVVHLMRDAAPSYANYPFMVYQIQTKFRDEPRARGGLIRVREFTMKDAYSFHASQEDLEEYYQKCYKAYSRIFARAGLSEDMVVVQSDSGMMGGKIAHEFMFLADVGEDSLVLCEKCGLACNMEVCECIVKNPERADEALEMIHTPGIKTIGELCEHLSIQPEQTCKAVMFRINATNELVIVFLRGDLDVNETKLRNFLKQEIRPDTEHQSDVTYGSCGPVGFTAKAVILLDRSVRGAKNLVTGANKDDYHYKGFSPERDCRGAEYHDLAKTFQGAVCPECGETGIVIKRGIEVGNIFQLGIKYTQAMGMQFVDADGCSKFPIMGCYGIGVGRLMASVCEARHDEYGPVWPMSIAPWQVHICAIRCGEEPVRAAAESLYKELESEGVEVLFDDRPVSAGVMFSDADLLGVPLRVIISPKTVARGVVEIKKRDKTFSKDREIGGASGFIRGLVKEMLDECRANHV